MDHLCIAKYSINNNKLDESGFACTSFSLDYRYGLCDIVESLKRSFVGLRRVCPNGL
jgi:hypothetical protein